MGVPGVPPCPNQGFTREKRDSKSLRDFDVDAVVVVFSELLAPPLGLAALERTLRLCDIGRELRLLAAELLLQLGERRFAVLELLEANLVVRVVVRLALFELLFAIVDLTDALAQVRFRLGDSLLAAVDALARRLGEVALLVERRLAVGDLLLTRLEPGGPLVEVAAADAIGLDPCELGVAAVELRPRAMSSSSRPSISARRASIS